MKAYMLDKGFNQIGEPFDIKADSDFDAAEIAAKESDEPCCIKWDRPSDGQTGYWSPAGATFEPHWYG